MDQLINHMKTLAALGRIGGEGFGTINNNSIGEPMKVITDIISKVIGFLTIVAAIWFLIQVLIAGISWISAAGEKNKLTEARERLTNAFIGLLVVVASYGILSLAGQFFGWTTITKPEDIINLIKF